MALNERRADVLVCLAAGAAAYGVYVLTLAPDMLPGDSGEFQMAAPLLSIVHPTGYPLYLLIAKLATLVPVGSIAYRVNLFSAASEALAIGVFTAGMLASLHTSGVASWPRRIIAASAALTFAFTATVWAQATEAEVYALHALFAAIVLGLAVRARDQHSSETIAPWLALALGLSFAHHRATVLLLPALLLLLWRVRLTRRAWFLAIALVALPQLLYLYTPLRYDATPYTRIALDPQHTITTLDDTPAAFVAHAWGSGFRDELRWDALSLERLAAAPGWMASEFGGVPGWLLIGLALLGMAAPWVAGRRNASIRIAAALVATLVVSVAFNAAYHIGDIADYYMPALMVTAWLAALGAAEVVRRVSAPAAAFGLALLSVALPVYMLVGGFGAHLTHAAARADSTALLAAAPANAILISNDRDEMTPFLYLQYVEGVRRDAVPLFPLISPDLPDVVRLTRYALTSARPVMFIKPMPGLETVFDVQSEGVLSRVTGLADVRYTHASYAAGPAARLLGWSQAGAANAITATLTWEAGTTVRPDFSTYVHVLDASGKTIAQSDHVPGGEFYPASQWASGEKLRDIHRIVLPADRGPGLLRLEAGAYVAGGSEALAGIGRVELGDVQIGP